MYNIVECTLIDKGVPSMYKEEKEVKLLIEKIKGKLIILDQEGNNVLEKKIRRFK